MMRNKGNNMEQIIIDFVQTQPWGATVLMVLGSLVVIGQIVVVVTPSKSDDDAVAKLKAGMFGKLIDMLSAFAPWQK